MQAATAVLDRPEQEDVEPDCIHFACECDPTISLCNLPLDEDDPVADDDDTPLCSLCAYVSELLCPRCGEPMEYVH